MATRRPILDQYTPLAHKAPIASTEGDTTHTSLAPSWIPPDERRRLDAYKVLAAYTLNAAREYLPDTLDQAARDARREYGDAALLTNRVRGAVLGDTLTITVDGAEPAPDRPDLPDPPEDPDDTATDIERRIHTIQQTRWQTAVDEAIATWTNHLDNQPARATRQQWLRDWAETEQLVPKVHEAEGDAVTLGDALYTLAWSAEAGRPVLEVHDPGFYFPVLTDTTRGYPTRVHVAWELERRLPSGKIERYVRRLTWELVDLQTAYWDPDLGDFRRRGDGTVDLRDGDTVDPDGRIVRRYPWQTPDDEPSRHTCLFSDGTWRWEAIGPRTIDDLDDSRGDWAVTDDGHTARRLDLAIDFLPVIHIPNTPASREHYGRSTLDVVAQVMDDLSASDTDLQAASALAAGPAIGLAGSRDAGALTVRPGAIYNLGEGGRMDVLDLSAGLQQLLEVNGALQERLTVNAQVPAEVLGRVKASEVPSGLALALAFSPFRQLIETLRLTRGPKYQLLLKMVQRIAQAAGQLEAGPTPVARLEFGPYLPADLAGVVELVVRLLEQQGISRTTALRLLADAGVDVGDLDAELAAIRADDTAGAVQVAEATASEQLAADRLGLELPEQSTVAPPAVTLPGADQGE